jgi:hypothetical protein
MGLTPLLARLHRDADFPLAGPATALEPAADQTPASAKTLAVASRLPRDELLAQLIFDRLLNQGRGEQAPTRG